MNFHRVRQTHLKNPTKHAEVNLFLVKEKSYMFQYSLEGVYSNYLGRDFLGHPLFERYRPCKLKDDHHL